MVNRSKTVHAESGKVIGMETPDLSPQELLRNAGFRNVPALLRSLRLQAEENALLKEEVRRVTKQRNWFFIRWRRSREDNKRLSAHLHLWEGRAKKDSQTSHKSPSSDIGTKAGGQTKEDKVVNKEKKKKKRQPGGQRGHKGSHLPRVETPDHKEVLPLPDTCPECEAELTQAPIVNVEKRQVFDLPPSAVEVTEYQAQSCRCLNCGKHVKAVFPEHVKAATQYGPRIKSLATYFIHRQLIPYERLQELFKDVFACELSQGTLVTLAQKPPPALSKVVDYIKASLIASPDLNADETSCRVNAKRYWRHVACTPTLTHYGLHEKRGSLGMRAIGVLPLFTGRLMHDGWSSYAQFGQAHLLCNSHHLRELEHAWQHAKQQWARALATCLRGMNACVHRAKAKGEMPSEKQQQKWLARYDRILALGEPSVIALTALINIGPRPKKHESHNLWCRLTKYKKETTAFLSDPTAPFSNNLAERDLRMTKVKQKISGTFRSLRCAEYFCELGSYLATARKNNVGAMQALLLLFEGNPYRPAFPLQQPP
jgi:transposase